MYSWTKLAPKMTTLVSRSRTQKSNLKLPTFVWCKSTWWISFAGGRRIRGDDGNEREPGSLTWRDGCEGPEATKTSRTFCKFWFPVTDRRKLESERPDWRLHEDKEESVWVCLMLTLVPASSSGVVPLVQVILLLFGAEFGREVCFVGDWLQDLKINKIKTNALC